MAIYQAYLLRLWLADKEATSTAEWRVSLEDPHTGKRLGFASLEHLFAFLLTFTEGEAEKVQKPLPDANQPPM